MSASGIRVSSGNPQGTATDFDVRMLRPDDLAAVVEVDGHHTGWRKPEYWSQVFAQFVSSEPWRPGSHRVALAAERDARLLGYLFAEVRAFEFGSEPCGWIFAVGVRPNSLRRGVASRLLETACARLREAGVSRVRTMVSRSDVPVLSFFRWNRFQGGSFVQLERSLDESGTPQPDSDEEDA